MAMSSLLRRSLMVRGGCDVNCGIPASNCSYSSTRRKRIRSPCEAAKISVGLRRAGDPMKNYLDGGEAILEAFRKL